MNYCDKHIPLDGCIPGDEVMIRRDDECTECVREERDMLRKQVASSIKRNEELANSLEAWNHTQ